MSCEQTHEQMYRYFDDELSESERREFERHLLTCSDCQMLYTETEIVIQRVSAAVWLKAPADFTDNLLDQLNAIAPPRKHKQPNWRLAAIKYTGIASAAAVVFVTGMMMAQPSGFALQAQNQQGLVVQDGKVIVPEGQTYTGDLVVQNGDLEVRGTVLGNVTTLNGKIYRAAGADISGETAEVDEALEKVWYMGKQLWNDITEWAR